jgi:rod shape-determining protein MreC
MREFLQRHRKAIVIFAALVVPLFLLFVHGRAERRTTVIEVGLMRITQPAQRAADRLLGGVADLWRGYVALVDVKEDNDHLRTRVRELSANALENKTLREENASLRRQLEFKRARADLRLVAATVIAKDINPYARVVRIVVDVGSEDGITEGMPVVTALGLVGRIKQVAPPYAEVMLAVDAKSSVSVKVVGKGVTGTVEGTGSGNDYTARLLYLHKAERLSEGDTLVTSGHDKVFPAGLEVGYVRTVEERQRGLYYELQVDPAVNFSVLETVQVVVGTVGAELAVDAAPGGPGKPSQGGATP